MRIRIVRLVFEQALEFRDRLRHHALASTPGVLLPGGPDEFGPA
jgi:hypothetical protein